MIFRASYTHRRFAVTIMSMCALLTGVFSSVQAKEINAAKMPGFDPANATRALQAALDSGADKVIVPNVGQPWIITPIQLRSNQTVVFEPGVVILAKKGEFHGLNDCLFAAWDVKNLKIEGHGATFRMHKKDYDSKPYTKGQWRHTLSLRGCTHVTIEDLTLEKSGGDGIYIAPGKHKAYCEDITIRNVKCVDNYRQGISVISVDHLLMDSVVMRDTNGTAPQAGIDFEPNHANERLSHIVMRNCVTRNNRGGGYDMNVNSLHADSKPISISIEHSQFIDDIGSAVMVRAGDDAPSGQVTFTNCTFKGSHRSGIAIENKPASAFQIDFKQCTIAGIPADKHLQPIQFASRMDTAVSVGGVNFEDCRIIDSMKRQPIQYVTRSIKAPLEKISGTLVITDPTGTHSLQLTANQLHQWFGEHLESVPYVSLDDIRSLPESSTSTTKQIKLGKVSIRKQAQFALQASKGDRVEVQIRFDQIGRLRGKTMPIKVTGPSGKTIESQEIPFQKTSLIRFTALNDGIYRIDANPGHNSVELVSSTNPISLITPDKSGVHLFKSATTFYIWVPEHTEKFAVQGAGDGGEGFRMVLKDPTGKTVEDIDNIMGLRQIMVEPKDEQTGAIWSLDAVKSSDLYFEDHVIKLLGIPPLLATTKQAVVKTRPR